MNKTTYVYLKTGPAKTAALVNVTVLGLLAGLAFCVQFALVPIWNRLDAPMFVQMMQTTIPVFTYLARPLMVIGLVTFLVRLARHRPKCLGGQGLMVASFMFFIAAGIITVVAMWPINDQMMNWAVQTPPATWEVVREKWDYLNLWRFVCALLGFLTGLITLIAGRKTETANDQMVASV